MLLTSPLFFRLQLFQCQGAFHELHTGLNPKYTQQCTFKNWTSFLGEWGGEELPYKKVGAARWTVWEESLRRTKILLCWRGLKCLSLLRGINSKAQYPERSRKPPALVLLWTSLGWIPKWYDEHPRRLFWYGSPPGPLSSTLISMDLALDCSNVWIKSMSSTGLPSEADSLCRILSSISFSSCLIFALLTINWFLASSRSGLSSATTKASSWSSRPLKNERIFDFKYHELYQERVKPQKTTSRIYGKV